MTSNRSIFGKRTRSSPSGGDDLVEIELRSMKVEDLNQIMIMENDLFTEPWPEEVFRQEIADPETSWSVVAEDEKGILCYSIAWLVKSEFHIANFAVRRDCQCRGFGGQLIDRALDEGRRSGCILASLEVRESNRDAIRLYESRDFRPIAIRKGYYGGDGEDAIVMIRELTDR